MPRTASTKRPSPRSPTVSAVPIEVVDRLMNGERADPVLILARAAGFGWPTVRDDHERAARLEADAARRSTPRARISNG